MASAVARRWDMGNLVSTLLGRTALGGVRSPFETFGPIAVAERQRLAVETERDPALSRMFGGLGNMVLFTAEEARRRLSDLLSGAFKPASGSQFLSYLSTQFLGIEKRTYGNGRSGTYIVDALTNESVAAAAIDPRKLNDRVITRTLGRDPVADKRALTEATAAMTYNSRLAMFLRDAQPFRDWKDLEFSLGGMRRLPSRAYVVGAMEDRTDFRARNIAGSPGDASAPSVQGYIGIKIGDCAGTAEETIAFIEKKRAEIKRRYGVKVSFVHDPELRVGTPILIADGNLVRAAKIDGKLSAAALEECFGQSFAAHADAHAKAMDHASGLRSAATTGSGPSNIVELNAFAARFRKKPDPTPEPTVASGSGFGFGGPGAEVAGPRTFDPRHVVIRYDAHGPHVWHVKRQHDLAEVPSIHLLPEGEYLKEDQFQMPMGKLRVDAEGNVLHLTMDGREHNFDGASFEPAPGNGQPRRWAIEGHEFERFRDFKAARDEIAAAQIAEDVARREPADDEPGSPRGFGYRA